MPQATLHAKIPIEFLFVVPFVLLLGFAALGFPYAPLQDFPEWIYQGYVFDKLVAGTPSALFEIKNYPVPYTLAQLILSGCLVYASPMTTSRITLALYAVATILSIRSVIARYRLQPLIGWPLFISFVALNAPFWDGYIAYQIGLLVLLFYLSLPDEARTDPKFILLFSLLAFFTHGCVFFAFAIFVGIYSLFARCIGRTGLAMLPSVGLLAWYLFDNPRQGNVNVMNGVEQTNIIFYKVYTLLKAGTYHDPIVLDFNAAAHFGHTYLAAGLALDSIFVLAFLVLAALAIRRTGWRTLSRKPELIIGVLLLAFTLALPRAAAGIVNPGERMLYPSLIALTLGFFSDLHLPKAPQMALALAVFCGIALFAIGLVAGSRTYKHEAGTPAVLQAEKNTSTSKEIWFGHRLMQFDTKMKYSERTWAGDRAPTMPLAFDTGLLATKTFVGAER